MKRIFFIALWAVLTATQFSCNAQNGSKAASQQSVAAKVVVYYFHFTRRCNTCLSVEENAKKAVESLYADKVKSGEYAFTVINLDDDSSKAIAEKLGVGGQTLLVVCGTNKIDITDKGFMNAHDLEKMKVEVKKAVGDVTKK